MITRSAKSRAAGKCLVYITAGSMHEASWICEALNGHCFPGLTVEPMIAVVAKPPPEQGQGQQFIPQAIHRSDSELWMPPELAHILTRPWSGVIPSMATRVANSRHRSMFHDGHFAMFQKKQKPFTVMVLFYVLFHCYAKYMMCQISCGRTIQSGSY